MMEKHNSSKYKGKSLSKIHFDHDSELAIEDDGADDVVESETNSVIPDVLIDEEMRSEEKEFTTVKNNFSNETPVCSYSSTDPEGTILNIKSGYSKSRIISSNINIRRCWTNNETNVVENYFKDYLKKGTYPSGEEIKQFITKTKINRTVPVIKSKIQHLMRIP